MVLLDRGIRGNWLDKVVVVSRNCEVLVAELESMSGSLKIMLIRLISC